MKVFGGREEQKDEARDVGTDCSLGCLVKGFTYRVIKVGGAIRFAYMILKGFKRDDIGNKDNSYVCCRGPTEGGEPE